MESSSCTAESTKSEGGSSQAKSGMSGMMGADGMLGQGVGSMQYQGSGMAPHEPLHPEGPEGSGIPGGVSHSGEEGSGKPQGVIGQPQMQSGMQPQGMMGQPQMYGGMQPQAMMQGQPQMQSGMQPQAMMQGQPQMQSGMQPQAMMQGQPQMQSGMQPQGTMLGQPQMYGGMQPQGMLGQPQMYGGMQPQGMMQGQPQMQSGMQPQSTMQGQPQMYGGMQPQGTMLGQPQMYGGMQPQGTMLGQPQMYGGMQPQVSGEVQAQNGNMVQNMNYSAQTGAATDGGSQQLALGDMNRYGQYLEMFTDMANGKTPDLPQIAQIVEQAPGDFWKGAIVGAAAGFIFTNESVRDGFGAVIGSMFDGAKEEAAVAE